MRFILLQPRSSREQRASIRLLPAAPGPREQKSLARINHSAVLGTSKSQHLCGSGYVVLLLLTGLPPFIIADALVLLLGVTPAFGTVSPTSCKDGSRYMATSDRKEGTKKRGKGNVTKFSSRIGACTPRSSLPCPVSLKQSNASGRNTCFKAGISRPQTEDITTFTFSGLYN